jgi:hypothetical protein
MWNYQLLVHITHNITDKPCLISFHGWQEMLLAVLKHIRSVMPVEVQAFLVVCVFKPFIVKPSSSSCQWDAMANLQIDLGKQLILHISFQAARYLIVNDVLQVLLGSFGNKFVLWEFGELFRIHCLFVWMDICPELSSNCRAWKQREHLCMVPSTWFGQLSCLEIMTGPFSNLTTTPSRCKAMTFSCMLRCSVYWSFGSAR